MLMLETVFKFTGKDLTKLSVLMVAATLLFGLPGLVIILFFQWITNQSYALESIDKHGISQIGASRLGGAAVFGVSLILYVFGSHSERVDSNSLQAVPMTAWLTIFVCMSIGLLDDLKSNLLSPRFRLMSTVLIFSFCLYFWPSLIPSDLGVPILDTLLASPLLGWFVTLIFCIGFINAINMADGANGLMSGILTVAFIVFYLETGLMVYAVLIVSCGLFAMFNVISGRLFLGDAGAYGLGSVLVISGLYLFSQRIFSAPFLAVLFSYPCLDILVTVVRRLVKGRSILLPDNDHLHNRVHFFFQKWFRSKTLANSMTGICIVSLSSGISLLGFTQEWWSVSSNMWIWVFFAQILIYSFVFILTGINRTLSQYVVDSRNNV